MSEVGLGVGIIIASVVSVIILVALVLLIAFFITRRMRRSEVTPPTAIVQTGIPTTPNATHIPVIPQEVPIVENIPVHPVNPQQPLVEVPQVQERLCSTADDCPPNTLCLGGRCISL